MLPEEQSVLSGSSLFAFSSASFVFWQHHSMVSGFARKPVFQVSNQTLHKPGFTTTEGDSRLKISDLRRDCTMYEVKTKEQICTSVFGYAKSRFSRDMAHDETSQ